MSGEATIQLTGTATAEPELKFTPSGAAVANFTVAVNPRIKINDQWQDGDPAFYRIAAWKRLGENVSASVRKGDRITVVGRLAPRQYEHNGEKRTSLDVTADSVALDVLFKPASFGEQTQRSTAPSAPVDDPWATPSSDTPPF